MSIEIEGDAAAKAGEGEEEIADGEIAYEALVTVLPRLPQSVVLGLVTAVQAGRPWEGLSLPLRQACVALEREILGEDEDEGPAER